jgi:hypothetical protein
LIILIIFIEIPYYVTFSSLLSFHPSWCRYSHQQSFLKHPQSVSDLGWPPFVDDFAGHPVLPTHLPDRTANIIGRSYTHVHTLPHPEWHKTKYTNFMAMNKQREMRFV